jgi:homoserine O-acetyltransferase
VSSPEAPTSAPVIFDVGLPPLALDCGLEIDTPVARGWCWSACDAAQRLVEAGFSVAPHTDAWRQERVADPTRTAPRATAKLTLATPTVVIVHALTADMRAGGPGGWWAPLIGPGRPLDPAHVRIVCINNLGSCYGSTGPDDPVFPRRGALGPAPCFAHLPGALPPLPDDAPAPITTADQARFLHATLTSLGIDRVDLLIGGSVGGMIATRYARSWPQAVRHLAPIAAFDHTSPWIQAQNHVARQILHLEGVDAPRALALARQLAQISYRAEEGLWERQGLAQVERSPGAAWEPHRPWRVATYLEHQGTKLCARFSRAAYLSQLDAMDHHEARRGPTEEPNGPPMTAVAIDSDQLFSPRWSREMVDRIRAEGGDAELQELHSLHGHDAFLIEWDQLAPILHRILVRAGLPVSFPSDEAPR